MTKAKFNIIDALIVVAVVLIAVVAVWFLGGNNDTGTTSETQNTTATFKIQLTKAEKSLYDKFLAGLENDESVWIGIKERFEGKLTGIELSPSSKVGTDLASGKAVLLEDPVLYDITLEVTADALETNSQISSSNTPIRVGEETAIRGKGFAGYGFVIDLATCAQ